MCGPIPEIIRLFGTNIVKKQAYTMSSVYILQNTGTYTSDFEV